VTKQAIDTTTDPECQALLRDLKALSHRANVLSRRLDREHVAVGKAWGITRGLDAALSSALREFCAVEEIGEDILPQRLIDAVMAPAKLDAQGRIVSDGPYNGMTPDQVRAQRDRYNRMCGE
jgi:hypothetical protein